jgi:hypothetical protein
MGYVKAMARSGEKRGPIGPIGPIGPMGPMGPMGRVRLAV